MWTLKTDPKLRITFHTIHVNCIYYHCKEQKKLKNLHTKRLQIFLIVHKHYTFV